MFAIIATVVLLGSVSSDVPKLNQFSMVSLRSTANPRVMQANLYSIGNGMNGPITLRDFSSPQSANSSSFSDEFRVPGFGPRFMKGQLLIGTSEVACMAILMAMPKSVTKWPDDYLSSAGRNINRAFTSPPVWDQDEFVINYIGHPYAGAAYYNTMRSQDASKFQSFAFCVVQSTIWEYVIEAVAEQPSIQDLIVTPVFGAILGEFSHSWTMSMRKDGFNVFEMVIVTIVNPMYVVMNGYR
jgi:hypothetical protein